MSAHFIEELRARELIAQISHEEELIGLIGNGTRDSSGKLYGVYCGFDPTAPSLHLGNLAAMMMLVRAQRAGFTPIVLFGGATGLIGDPTGRTEMRQMHSKEEIEGFIENFKKLSARYFQWDVENKPIVVNNMDWIGPMSWIDFSRNVGRHFTIAKLLAAEVNKTRFEQGGLTFMELGYQLLQSYDFFYLFEHYNCILQFGGNDQWSNVLGGADLIRRIRGEKAFAVTTPLLVGADGKKFGKTAGNAIWLDPAMTSPFKFFQFFRNVHDLDIKKMLRVFTLLSLEEIDIHIEGKDINKVKELMAFEITKWVHGSEEAQKALETSQQLFHGNSIDEHLEAAPTTFVKPEEVLNSSLDILSLLIKCGFSPSRGEARKLIQGNGLTFNGEKFNDIHYKILEKDFNTNINGLILKKGKKEFHIVKLE
ncbi:MAG: tyrosine--tRNA ligase [Silvanigrellaceae bacterium]|nr:tyrosine--tRNA ligase [Silvanigrellaceae bacterium]